MAKLLHFKTNGKLLLSGEYFVLDGALALAIPCKYGQSFEIELGEEESPFFYWQSYDDQNKPWFEGKFSLPGFEYLEAKDKETGKRISQILAALHRIRPDFEDLFRLKRLKSFLDFPRNWGLGSSSTLISALARWSEVDAYQLLQASFGGSGYDLACALAQKPLLYQIHHNKGQAVEVPYYPDFADQLYFIHLGKKQNSRTGIQRYRDKVNCSTHDLDLIGQLTLAWLKAGNINALEKIIQEHETFIAQKLELNPVKSQYFSDYWGAVKSLGAWGGDFVLATSDRSAAETIAYFKQKGLSIIIKYEDMLFKP